MDAVIALDHKGPGDIPPGDTRGGAREAGTDHERIIGELRLLLAALAQRADEYLSSRAEAASAPSCGWCPLCTVVELVRDQRPEFRLVEQLAAAVAVIRQTLAEPQDETPQPDPPDPAPDVKVQRINLQRVGGNILRGQAGVGEGRGC